MPQEIIEQIAAANDIVEVIGGYFPLKRAGGAYRALCPFHRERTPSFQVNPHRQMFKCFGCGAGGSVFRFVMDYEHIDFMAAVRKLAERARIKIPEAEMSAEDYQRADLRRRLLALHAEAAEFFHTQLMRGKSADGARDYLKQRGLSAEVAKSWKIGFAPDAWDALLSHARAQGYTGDELAGSGLFSQGEDTGRIYDRFRGRIMFPICNDTGEVIAFSGRVLSAEQSPAKYVNSPETMLFTKGAVLFGLHKSKRALIEKKQAIVCEGQIDLITAFENGVQNVIAPQGTAFTERQARILKRYVEEVVLCFDADAAGEKAAERSLPYLLGAGLQVRCAEMPPGEDPDTLVRKRGGEAFAALIGESKDFFDFQLDRLAHREDFATPRGKIAAAKKLAEFISLIPEAVAKEAVLHNAATRLEVGAEQLRTLLGSSPAQPSDEDDALLQPAKKVDLDKTQEMLLVMALRDSDARDWLLSQDWRKRLDDGTPGARLIETVLDATFRPDNTASIAAFLGSLNETDERTLSGLLEQNLPPDPKSVLEDCWRELSTRDLKRRRDVLTAKLHASALSEDEQNRLYQELYELHQEFATLALRNAPKFGD